MECSHGSEQPLGQVSMKRLKGRQPIGQDFSRRESNTGLAEKEGAAIFSLGVPQDREQHENRSKNCVNS